MNKTLFICCLFVFSFSYSQINKKSVFAKRVTVAPHIDGILDDSAWKNAQEAKDFVMFEPGSGLEENESRKTIVKVVYDDQAIYFGAMLFDDNPAKIPMQFGERDHIGQVDFFQVNINPNNDGQNDTEFIVMSTGAQADSKANSFNNGGGFGHKDFSWSAVWYSEVSVNDNGWVVEIKIPYAALRFANTNVQVWGINFQRNLRYYNEQYSWNFIDKTKGEYTQYSGILNGIENIKPPTRLSLYPYASAAITNFEGDSEIDFNAGLDLKYGINESFTLDATLIPDFGQTAFDEQELNLSPFEQHFDEKRAFFTEGTELFGKGDLFYSRRVGNEPVGYEDIEENLEAGKEIVENPYKVNMLNAIKLSGRTKKGLGIAVFNAITEKTYAKIRDINSDEIETVITEPFTNYNVLVLDQQFNKNSAITLVNTNVLRNGSFKDANATGLLFDISDKGNKYNISGNIKMSNTLENGEKNNGYASYLALAKTHGNFQYSIGHWRSDQNYDINDLGFQRRNNYANYNARLSYEIFEPNRTFDRYRIELEANLRYQNNPYEYAGNEFEFDTFFITKNRFAFGVDLETNIGRQKDFYEPRVDGRFFEQYGIFVSRGWFSTDYRKKFALDVRNTYALRYNHSSRYYAFEFSPRFRFSDKFQIIYEVGLVKLNDDFGWVDELEDGSIIFGERDYNSVTNSLSGKLSFNTKSSLGLSFRHYWSPVKYNDNYFILNDRGTLDNTAYTEIHNINYNIWNLDLSYSWEFAPGSQLVALYRNSIFNEDSLSRLSFSENLNNLFKEPAINNFSLKFIYYLDYNKLKTAL